MAQLPVASDPAHHPSALLDYLARKMRLRTQTKLAPLGLRPRHLVALTVLRDRGGSTQQALTAILGMDGTNIVGLLNELEAGNLIERRRSPEDRRRHLVELTDTGAQQLAKAECALSAVENEVLSALDATQRETLYHLLQQAVSGTETACTEAIRETTCTEALQDTACTEGIRDTACTEGIQETVCTEALRDEGESQTLRQPGTQAPSRTS